MLSRINRGRLVCVAATAIAAAFSVVRGNAQSSSVQLAEGSGVQPLFVLDSGAAWSARWFPLGSCTATLSPMEMTRDSIYLDARMDSVTGNTFAPQADLIAHDVAAEIRARLGGSESSAPHVGATFKWYSVPAELIVTARPDGSVSARGLSASGSSDAVDLLAAALDSARHHGGGLLLWPEGYAADSVVLRLSLLPKSFDDRWTIPLKSKRMRFLAFSMLHPIETPALPKAELNVRYPSYNERHRVEGNLIAQFVVDTSGKAIMSTFKDVWPANTSRLSGALADYYADFVRAVREGVAKETFTPAHVGSCAVRQIVQWPVEFHQPKSAFAAP